MNAIVKILMERDGMSKEDATEMYEETRSEIEDAISCGDFNLAEDILAGDLGLEPDYFIDMLCI